MTAIAFKFETDPQMGIPRLHAVSEPGRKSSWSARDLHQVEELLRSRYESLVRDGSGMLNVLGRTFQVRKQFGDTSRQPTLEVFLPAAGNVESPSTAHAADASSIRPMWFRGWLDEVEQLIDSELVVRAERVMLDEVLAELRTLSSRLTPRTLTHLVFTAVVSMADQLSRTHQPGLPHPYPFALSGLERLQEEEPVPPWGQFTTDSSNAPPRSWLGRLWPKLKRE